MRASAERRTVGQAPYSSAVFLTLVLTACGRLGYQTGPEQFPDATAFDLGPVTRIATAGPGRKPALAPSAQGFGVVWTSPTPQTSVWFAPFDDSAIQRGDAVRLDQMGARLPVILPTATSLAVLWRDFAAVEGVTFATVSSDGTVLGSQPVTSGSPIVDSTFAAGSGSGYGVIWGDSHTGSQQLFFIPLDASGNAVAAETQLSVSLSGATASQIEFTGSGFVVLWQQTSGEVRLAHLNGVGFPQVPVGTVSSVDGTSIDMAWNGSDLGLVWMETRPDMTVEFYFSRVNVSGAEIVPPIRIAQGGKLASTGSNDVQSIAIDWTGDAFSLLWVESVAGHSVVHGALVDLDGTVLAHSVVSEADQPEDAAFPSITNVGNTFTAVWQDLSSGINGALYMRQLSLE